MNHIVFLLEEYSMKVFLEGFLPRFFPNLQFLCVPHQGKQDLEKSIPRKLKAWREPGVRFVVIRDNDGGNCKELKEKLIFLCKQSGREDSLVRIPCQELEAWYLGDFDALATAFDNKPLHKSGSKAYYKNPDCIPRPSRVLEKLVPQFQKVSCARRMAVHLDRHRNVSHSFNVFMKAIERIAQEI